MNEEVLVTCEVLSLRLMLSDVTAEVALVFGFSKGFDEALHPEYKHSQASGTGSEMYQTVYMLISLLIR